MLMYISQWRFLIPFVVSFVFGYTLVYAHLAQANYTPVIGLVTYTEEVTLIPVTEFVKIQSSVIKTVDLTDYQSFPDPKGDGNFNAYRELFEFVSTTTGVDVKLLAAIAASESSFRAKATPGGTNSAKGLFQFTDDTWGDVVAKYGHLYGITQEVSPFDPKANTIMAAMHLKNASKRVFGEDVEPVKVYLIHFLGPTGAKRFVQTPSHKVAAKHMPAAAKRNKEIFFNEKNKPKTFKEVYATLDTRLIEKGIEFHIN